MSSWRKLLSSATLLVAVAMLWGCGTNTGTSGTNNASKTSNSSSANASNVGGTVVDGITEEPSNLNPILGPSMIYDNIVGTSMFRNLFILTPKGTLQPDIATTVPTVSNGGISKNGLTYTLHLRHDVKWSDGTKFTVKDVKETYELITNPQVNAVTRNGWDDVAQFKTIDNYDFQLTLKNPDPALLSTIFGTDQPGIIPYHIFKNISVKDVNTTAWNHDPIPSDGPFKFVSWQPGASITVARNPYWYGPKPKVDKLVFRIVPNEPTLLSSAQTGAINVWYYAPIEDYKLLQKMKGANVKVVVDPAWEGAVVNMTNPILQDVRVRQALEMGIDRKTLTSKIWYGLAPLLAADQSSVSWSYNPSLTPYPYDPAKAKKLLNEAGWTMGSDGYMQKNGKELSLVYSTTSGRPFRSTTERLIQSWFKNIGVKLTIKNYPANTFFGTVLPSGKGWDLAEFGNIDTGGDPAGTPSDSWTTNGPQNFGKYSNSKLDKLFSKQAILVSQAQRKPILQQVESTLHNDLPELWFYAPPEIDASFNMNGYQPNPWDVDTWNCWAWQPVKQ